LGGAVRELRGGRARDGSDEWAAVIEDARGFMDFERLTVAWTEARVVVPATGQGSPG
jgi:hypothetical protein